MDEAIRSWLAAVAPWVAIGATLWVAYRVQAVHKLVNSEMDSFRETLRKLAIANEAAVFVAGQQNIRDANRSAVSDAAKATDSAAQATGEAAKATTAAAEAVASVAPPPAVP